MDVANHDLGSYWESNSTPPIPHGEASTATVRYSPGVGETEYVREMAPTWRNRNAFTHLSPFRNRLT